MQPGLSEVAGDVESDPGAVLEAHGADSVEDLVAPEPAEEDAGDDAAVAGLLDGSLSAPERSREHDRSHDDAGQEAGGAVMAQLERAADDPRHSPEPERSAEDLAAAVEDDDVAAALADAEDLHEGDLPDAVPFE